MPAPHPERSGVPPIAARDLHAIFAPRVDLVDAWAESLQVERPSTIQRITTALGSDRIIPLYLAFVSGSFFTLAMAIVWARLGL